MISRWWSNSQRIQRCFQSKPTSFSGEAYYSLVERKPSTVAPKEKWRGCPQVSAEQGGQGPTTEGQRCVPTPGMAFPLAMGMRRSLQVLPHQFDRLVLAGKHAVRGPSAPPQGASGPGLPDMGSTCSTRLSDWPRAKRVRSTWPGSSSPASRIGRPPGSRSVML